MDEPFSALDYQSRLVISDDIYNILKKEKKTMIMVTHDIAEPRCLKCATVENKGKTAPLSAVFCYLVNIISS